MKLLALAAMAASMSAVPVSAAVYNFSVVSTVQDNGDPSYVPNYQFSIDTATESNADDFFSNDYSFTFFDIATSGQRPYLGSPGGDVSYSANYNFFTADTGGAFSDELSSNFLGEQLFSGTTDDPQFRIGRFDLFNGEPNGSPDAVLTISQAVAAAPEPASWALMIGGFGIVGATMRISRRRSSKEATVALA